MRVKEYISYSQLMTIERSEKEYIEKYVYGKKSPINRAQVLGKQVSDALETGEQTGYLMIDLMVPDIPNYEIKDKEIMVTMGEIPIMLKIDGLKGDLSAIIEHKTGPEGSWNQKKADQWDQITFYCTGIYLKNKKIPTAKLVHIITEYDEDAREYLLTGNVKIFDTVRSYKEILIMMGRIKRAWEKIGVITKKELL